MHRTDHHDVAFVIRGSVEPLLADGSSTELHAGDVFVMPCTVHGIRFHDQRRSQKMVMPPSIAMIWPLSTT